VRHALLRDGDLGELLPDQRGQGLPWARGALQASAVIWARWSGVKGRRAPARGASRTTAVVCPRQRHCLTVSGVQPTWSKVGMAPVGMVVREQQQAGPLHLGAGGGVAGAEVL
jgi:hypothetical protein